MAKERRTNERASNGKRVGKQAKLPAGVEQVRDKYRARWPRLPGETGAGRYKKGPVRVHEWEAAKDAQEGRERYEKAMAGHKVQRGEWTLAKAMEAVLDECRIKENKPATTAHYVEHFRVLKQVWPEGRAPLRSVTREQVELFRDERRKMTVGHTGRQVSARTVRHELQILSRCFEVAIKRGYVGDNPVKHVTRPKVRRKAKDYFGRGELLALLDRVRRTEVPRVDSHADADLMLLLFATGLRRAEVARLRVGDINFERGTFTVDGKMRPRTMYIPGELEPLLRRIIAWPENSYERTSRNLPPLAGKGPAFKSTWEGEGRERYLLPGESESLRIGAVRRVFRRWKKELDEPRLRAHALRHSFTAHLYAWHKGKEFVSALAGHERENDAADHYIHYQPADLIEGMALLWKPGKHERGAERPVQGREESAEPSAEPDEAA